MRDATALAFQLSVIPAIICTAVAEDMDAPGTEGHERACGVRGLMLYSASGAIVYGLQLGRNIDFNGHTVRQAAVCTSGNCGFQPEDLGLYGVFMEFGEAFDVTEASTPTVANVWRPDGDRSTGAEV